MYFVPSAIPLHMDPVSLVARETLSRSEIALIVCMNSASAAIDIASSLSVTRSVVDATLGILVE